MLYRIRDVARPATDAAEESRVAIVAIDEETYASEPFRDTPKVLWTRQIAEVLNAVLDGGAAVVGFDVVFPTSVEPQLRGYDRALLRMLHKAASEGRVVLGMMQHSKKPITPYIGYQLAVGRGRNIHPLNVISDEDGVIRRVPLFFQRPGGGELLPSLPVEIALRMTGAAPIIGADGQVRIGANQIPAGPEHQMRIAGLDAPLRNIMTVNFAAELAAIPTYSLVDLYECAVAKRDEFFRRQFAGKAVLLGTVLDVEDRKLTSIRFVPRGPDQNRTPRCARTRANEFRPEFERQSIPGVYLQATAINNLLRGDALRELPREWSFLVVGLISLISAAIALRFSAFFSAVGALAIGLAWATAATLTFAEGLILPLIQSLAAAGLTVATLNGYRFAVADRTGRHIRKAFGHFLAPTVVDSLIERNRMPEQGGEMRDMTVWILDIAKYSTISENLRPPELVDFLNTVYTEVSDTIEAHRGFVAQFVGDAVVAAFGAPLDDPDHATNGVRAALACVERIAALNASLKLPLGMPLSIRIGVSSGDLLVGNIGSKRRLSYAIVGDDINLSSRLEGANKVYATTILVNGATVARCGPDLVFREIDTVRVVGRDTPVQIFEPLGAADTRSPESRRRMEFFAEALTLFRERRFAEAAEAFERLAAADPPARYFADRARALAADPPAGDWDGVNVLETK